MKIVLSRLEKKNMMYKFFMKLLNIFEKFSYW